MQGVFKYDNDRALLIKAMGQEYVDSENQSHGSPHTSVKSCAY